MQPTPSSQPSDADIEAVIDAMGPLLGLDVTAAYRPGIAANIRVTAAHAARLLSVPLDDSAEPAAVFHP